jgi:membrane protease YdiL (CAAX protease family)
MKPVRYMAGLFKSTFQAAEAEATALRGTPRSGSRTAMICVLVAFCLTMNKYFSDTATFYWVASKVHFNIHKSVNTLRLLELGWWVAVLFTFYFMVPALFIRLVLRERLRDYGLKLQGAFRDYGLYVAMLMFMIPLVLFFSATPGFQARYPFYEMQKGDPLFPHFIAWEALYFLQFCALEFFFRGFMVHGTRQTFGYYSVFVMTIPYCMIHFGKPFPETLAAIIAGIVLGTLSLKSRSVWLGIAIHYSVAITMDLCALWQKGVL